MRTRKSASGQIFVWVVVVVIFSMFARESSANLILYINDPTVGTGTQAFEVVLMDGKQKNYVIQNTDTTFSALWGHVVTADDVDLNTQVYDAVPDGQINVSDAGLVDVNNRLDDFNFDGELTAYTSVDSIGGRSLYTKATVEGYSATRKQLIFAATYNFTFSNSAWYYWHSASGFATDSSGLDADPSIIEGDAGNGIPAMTTFGGINDSGQDFDLTQTSYGGTPLISPIDSKQYALPDPSGDGNVYTSGLNAGLYTMTANFSVYLSADQKLQFQSATYTVTPEPASIAVWVIGGLVLLRRKASLVAVRIKSGIS